MNQRSLTALAIGFFVVVLGVMTVAVVAPSPSQSRAQASDAKLDDLHLMRPTAATREARNLSPDPFKEREVRLASDTLRRHDLDVFLWTSAVRHYEQQVLLAKAAAAAAARSKRVRYATTSHRSSGSTNWSGGPGGVLACIRHRESRGNYGAINPSSGTAGAYQFMPGTWNNNARSAGRQDLVGKNPASASPGDQDAMAQHLLSTQGLGPWGGGCH